MKIWKLSKKTGIQLAFCNLLVVRMDVNLEIISNDVDIDVMKLSKDQVIFVNNTKKTSRFVT